MANTKRSLQTFAQVIERKLNTSKGPDAMANLVCRLMTGKDPKIAAHMASKWVEWRYGKATETVNVFGNQQPVMVMIGATEQRFKALKQADRFETNILDSPQTLETNSIEASDPNSTCNSVATGNDETGESSDNVQ